MSDVIRKPSARAALIEQVRMVGLSLRGEALVACVLVGFLSVGMLVAAFREGLVIDLRTDNHPLYALLGALLPFAVWKGRDRLHEGPFLVMPVEHRRHVLLRILAGWCWLLAAIAALLLWQAGLALLSGGGFGATSTRFVLEGAQAGATVPASALREVEWTTQWWQWLLPLTGASVAYALGSAINVATRYPLRIVGVVVIAVLLLGFATGEHFFEWVRVGLHPLLVHPWGLDTVVHGGRESLQTSVRVGGPGADLSTVWRDLPTFGAWLGATLLWSVLSAIVLWAATLRLRER